MRSLATLLSGMRKMEMGRIWAATILTACLIVVQPLAASGQMQKGVPLLDMGAGMDIRFYNDYDEKLPNVGVGLIHLVTDWLVIGAGGRSARTSPSVNGSVTCLLNAKPEAQKTILFVRIGAGTTGSEGAGQMWFWEAGVGY